jgi:hypothetical protein
MFQDPSAGQDAIGQEMVHRACAHCTIGFFRGNVSPEDRNELEGYAKISGARPGFFEPVVSIRIETMASLVANTEPGRCLDMWRRLSRLSSGVLKQSAEMGVFESYDSKLDMPFAYLPVDSVEDLRESESGTDKVCH